MLDDTGFLDIYTKLIVLTKELSSGTDFNIRSLLGLSWETISSRGVKLALG